ncbi:MAG TPA: amine dehydrogenase large subunit [Steroidobacteraceae bacterium]|nr:amine dehydrogenase large subunit [Steroidobacteraceae bacterium]
MRSLPLAVALIGLWAWGALAATPPAPLPAEHLTVEKLAAPSPHWIYVFDAAFDNEIDQRVRLYDGDTHRRLGQIDAGFTPGFNLSPDGAKSVVATTYYSRGSRGTRTDVVEFTDNATLSPAGEIVLPNKRAMTAPNPFSVAYSEDGHFVYAAYITPAASFGVLDPVHLKVLSEIDTAGCVLVIPGGANRVSSLCESGRLLTVSLDAEGHDSGRSMSEPFFNPDNDPVFVQGIRNSRGYTFLSFLGEVHEVDFSGTQPSFAPVWSLVSAAEKGHWRPGAEQVGALHRKLGRLYVPMHEGGEGTHKDGGTEVWVFDVASHKRVARWPVQGAGLKNALALQVSQDDAPLLFVATANSDVAIFDALTGHLKYVEKHLGQTPWMLLNP